MSIASPSYRFGYMEALPDAYAVARLQAALALGVDDAVLSTACPWSAEQVLATDYWPAA